MIDFTKCLGKKTATYKESRNHSSKILTYDMFQEIVGKFALKKLIDSFQESVPQDITEEITEQRAEGQASSPRVTVENIPITTAQDPADENIEEWPWGQATTTKAMNNAPNTSVDINVNCVPDDTVGKQSALEEVLQCPNTPKRKFKRNTERMPSIMTCRTWKALFEEKENKKKDKAFDKEEIKKKREEKKELKEKKVTIKRNNCEKKGMCFKCTKTVRPTDLVCSLCKKVFHRKCVPDDHKIHMRLPEDDDSYVCHKCFQYADSSSYVEEDSEDTQ
ncbi:hypothetical protein FQA39_LY07209 [Lamprigera yunnana]|nr:hypothetical protein FQA39_LY07209 [Lamprigera yunnana]